MRRRGIGVGRAAGSPRGLAEDVRSAVRRSAARVRSVEVDASGGPDAVRIGRRGALIFGTGTSRSAGIGALRSGRALFVADETDSESASESAVFGSDRAGRS